MMTDEITQPPSEPLNTIGLEPPQLIAPDPSTQDLGVEGELSNPKKDTTKPVQRSAHGWNCW